MSTKSTVLKKVLKSLSMTLIRAVCSWPPSRGSWECLIQTHFSICDRNFPFENSQGKKREGMGGKLVRSEADMSAVSLRGPETWILSALSLFFDIK